jgi:hypothetical protein
MLLEKWLSACKKMKLDPCLSPCSSNNLKWIKDLDIRPKILKLVHEREGKTLEAISLGKDFLNRTPGTQHLRDRMDKWNYIKVKIFYTRGSCTPTYIAALFTIAKLWNQPTCPTTANEEE